MKKNFKFSILILTALLAALALAIGGCGGSGGGSSSGASLASGKAAGQAKVTIKWPARAATKLIPVASNSIVIRLSFNGAVVGSQTAVNPGNGGTTTVFFPTLPVGAVGVTAAAYPSADGSGTAQASGSSTLTVTNGGTASLTLTMGSTIASLQIGSSFTNPLPINGAAQTLTVEALDAAGDMVLVTPATIIWGTDSPQFLSVVQDTGDTGATVMGVASGDGNVFVEETESGAFAELPVQVRGPVTNLQITAITPSMFMGALMQFTLIATDAAGNTVSNPPGLNWTSSSPQYAQIAATTGLCQAEVNGTVQQTTTITVSATGVASATSVLTILPGTGTGSFLSPHTVTLNGSAPQQFVISSGTTKANGVAWSIPIIANAVGSLGTIDSTGLYTAPAQAPQVNMVPQNVTVQGISGGQTFTAVVTIN